MDADLVLFIGRRAMETAMLMAAPSLGVALVVGVVVAMIQAVTSIRDMTMGLVLKIACIGITLLICGGWMMQVAVGFTSEIFNHIQAVGLGQ
jgi:flagellar biosynthetic protein FliQ